MSQAGKRVSIEDAKLAGIGVRFAALVFDYVFVRVPFVVALVFIFGQDTIPFV